MTGEASVDIRYASPSIAELSAAQDAAHAGAESSAMVDPIARDFLDRLAAANGPNIEDMEPQAARAMSDPFLAQLGGPPPAVAAVEDRHIPGPRAPIHIRIYKPEGNAPFGVLVYFHGGGYVYGSVETHDSICRLLANEGACIVVSVDYGLAPEYQAPAPFDDAFAATTWVVRNAASFGGDPSRVAVGGDSAGGSLAAQVCLAARDRRAPQIVFQLLVYPGLDIDFTRQSYVDYGDGYLLTLGKIKWFLKHYIAADTDPDLPYLCPLRATTVAGLPPALIIVAECDPIRDEGIAYARRLEAEGGPARLIQYDGQIHAFFSCLAVFPKARDAAAEAGAALREAFGRASGGEPASVRGLTSVT